MKKQLWYYNQFKRESKEEERLEIRHIEMNLQMETELGGFFFFFLPYRVGTVVFPLERIHLHVYRQELFGTVISYLQFIRV